MPQPRSAGDAGSTSLGDFDLGRQIGSGAFGKVCEATSKRDLPYGAKGAVFAIKIYHADVLTREDRMRLEREYRTGLTLRHPNLVRFHDLVIDGEHSFLVMDLCDGQNLIRWRQSNPDPSGDFVLQFVTQMLEVLEFLHSSGRIHRDIKPTNINVDSEGRVRLLDYGLVLDLRDETRTTPNGDRCLGTLQYAAPETIFEKAYDHKYSPKSDLYSLGATLYYLLYGVQIFDSFKTTSDLIEAKRQHNISFSRRFEELGYPFHSGDPYSLWPAFGSIGITFDH